MPSIEQAKAMLRMAKKDLDALVGMGNNPIFAEEIYGFHVQQSVEKSLKAWLASLNFDFPHTHDLRRLLLLLKQQGADVAQFLSLVEYSMYSVQARYEEGLPESDVPLDRDGARNDAGVLFEHVAVLLDPREG